jgi:MFS family permease
LFFLQDRGKYNTGYFVTYFGSLMVSPIISGPMAQAAGWCFIWWLNVAILAVNTITLVFVFPETKRHRLRPPEFGHNSPAAAHSDVSSTDKGHLSNGNVDEINEKPAEPISRFVHSETATQDPSLGKGKPSKDQFRFRQPAN